jgi:translation initiation factor 2B subunit (eIF-2B alpha/beta/delta family)
MSAQTNEGFVVSGNGSVNATNIAVGSNAEIIHNVYNQAESLKEAGKDDIGTAITEILKILENNSDIPNKETAIQEVQVITEEVKKDKPNKYTLKGLLDSLQESLGSVTDIAGKVVTLRQAIALMMGLSAL